MPNVLFIVPSLRRAGAETQVVDLVNSLRDSQVRAQLLCFQNDLSQKDRVSKSVNFHYVPRRSKYDLSFISGIADVIDREKIDIVHASLEFSVLVGWLACVRAKCSPRLVAVIHTTLLRGFKEKLHDRLVYQWVFRRCDSVVFVCQKQADYWLKRYPFIGRKYKIIHNGIDLERYNAEYSSRASNEFRARFNIADNACVISCIAGFRPEKGHELLVEAFRHLDMNVHLFLAGDGGLREYIISLVNSFGISDRVHFLGNVADVRPLLVSSDVTVLASTAVETFSIAMLESMAMGVPMIAPDIGGLSEAIIHDKTGWLYPAGDVDALRHLLQERVSDSSNLKTVGTSARNYVKERFTKEVMADQTAALLCDVVK